MRVLYLIPGLGRGGGAERSLAAMVPDLVAAGVDLHVVYCSDRDDLVEPITAAGARVTRLAGSSRWALLRELTALVRRDRPDLIHTTLFEADLAGRLAGLMTRTPVVSSLVNVAYGPDQLGDPSLRRSRVRLAHFADALTARVPAGFHALSEEVADVMGRRLMIRRSAIRVMPRGRSEAEIGERTAARRERARTSLGIADDQFVVLTAGRHEYQKGIDLAVAAFGRLAADLPQALMLCAGREGTASNDLRDLVEREGLSDRVRILGQRDDVIELMCAADVFVVPSRWEGFGSILIEAMAIGVPTVATDIGAIRSVAGEPPVFVLVPPGDPAAIAAAIEAVMLRPEAAADRAALGRQRFRQSFTSQRVTAEMIRFYEDVLEGRASSRSKA